MYKFILAVAFLFSGCSYFTVNGAMCDKIANDPTATVPQECRVYIEEKAAKASRNEIDILDPNDAIKFEGDE